MNIIQAIRKVCEQDNGFRIMFDESKGIKELKKYCTEFIQLDNFTKLIYGSARNKLIELLNNVSLYLEYINPIVDLLKQDGLNEKVAKETLDIFFITFAFPGYKNIDREKENEFVCYETDKFKMIYKGESENNIENGIGKREQYYDGKWCGVDECLFINGKMVGYCILKELELESFMVEKISFVIDDYCVGKIKHIYDDGEIEYLDGEKLNIN